MTDNSALLRADTLAASAQDTEQPNSLKAIFRPYLPLVLVLFVCQIGQAAAMLMLPNLSADVIDKGILADDVPHIFRVGGIMLAAAFIQLILSAAGVAIAAHIAMSVGRDIRRALFFRVQSFSLAELNGFSIPSLITRNTNDVQQLQNMLVMLLTMIMIAPIIGFGAAIMAVRQDASLSLLLLVSVPILIVTVGLILGRTLPLFSRMQGQIDRVNAVLREQIDGLRVIRAFVRDETEQQRFATANDALTGTALKTGRLMALNMPAVVLVLQMTSVAVVWFGAGRIGAGAMPVGALVAFLSYIVQIMISVMIASMLFAFAPRALVSARRISAVLSVEPEIRAPAVIRHPSADAPLSLSFNAVDFGYPGAERSVLSDISFSLEPGETVGIIGSTGSGKSTLINLIPRLYDVSGGSVTIGGVDVRDRDPDLLRHDIGLVPQKAFLFSGTIASNLRFGAAEASDEDLWHALEIAQARDFVENLPDRLDALVAQGGDNFSGGQRQRLTIARALAARPKIYLFDDSFSALDYATDRRLRTALGPETRNAATLIVGQRVATLQNADRIIVLDNGHIAGIGGHEELMRTTPAYAEIVASQTRREGEE
ncbi:ABC transporter ATP-binding protein [Martelella sp. HB161492]|uniref:ABC transporter ATP-binding protein n=1 Tax=Martelella sp. HB161492 TaxID=2720726 RepID=UPI00159052D2|nr:ABC transporter ATP-binding protein [Martelella sp. HB161492]